MESKAVYFDPSLAAASHAAYSQLIIFRTRQEKLSLAFVVSFRTDGLVALTHVHAWPPRVVYKFNSCLRSTSTSFPWRHRMSVLQRTRFVLHAQPTFCQIVPHQPLTLAVWGHSNQYWSVKVLIFFLPSVYPPLRALTLLFILLVKVVPHASFRTRPCSPLWFFTSSHGTCSKRLKEGLQSPSQNWQANYPCYHMRCQSHVNLMEAAAPSHQDWILKIQVACRMPETTLSLWPRSRTDYSIQPPYKHVLPRCIACSEATYCGHASFLQ